MHDRREVERGVDVPNAIFEQAAHTLGPGGCGGGDHDTGVRPAAEKLLDERLGGLDLPHRDRVDPDVRLQGVVAVEAQSFPPTLTICGRAVPSPSQTQQQERECEIE